jgi:hypothetical protein
MITTGAPGGEPGAPATPGTVIVVPGFTTMTGDPPGNPGVLLAEGAAGTAGPVPGPTPVPGFTIITGDPAGNPGDAIGTVGPVPGPTPVPGIVIPRWRSGAPNNLGTGAFVPGPTAVPGNTNLCVGASP